MNELDYDLKSSMNHRTS